uniref:Glycosyltransferase n=1 Tax=Fervidobacterium nodosum TaxID=2424 RepID=A0A7C5U4B9_9BACT
MLLNIFVLGLSFFISLFYLKFSIKKKLNMEFSSKNQERKDWKVSVIIPARNEERNIGKILSFLSQQSIPIYEIIVVDDNSWDKTYEIASSFKNVKVVRLTTEPPKGWVGKSWAIWNGYLSSSGDLLVFMDADVEPSYHAIESLVTQYEKYGGLISVWPYQRFERFYEHLSLTFNFLVVYASNMLGFPSKKPSGVFGPVILTSRKDYEYTGGHEAVRDSVLEDIKLGKLYVNKGIRVTNFIGNGIIKFRMYPEGFKQLFEGFSKNMSSGAISGGFINFLLAFVWIAGFYSSFSNFTFPIWYILLRHLVFSTLVYILSKSIGGYKWYDALLYPVHFSFFLIVFFYSLYRTVVVRKVTWRGREIDV